MSLYSFCSQMWASQDGTEVEPDQPMRFRRRSAAILTYAPRLGLYLGLLTVAPIMAWSQGTYTTNFPATANPISEGGRWINGKVNGLNWSNVQTTAGFAFGTQGGSGGTDDSTAVLSGNWGPNQSAQATVHFFNALAPPIYEEVELRLRTSISANSITGYEINFQASSASNAYIQIVRWNGPLNNFTYVNSTNGPGLHDGDVVKATMTGSIISVFLNGVQVLQGTDSIYTGGRPGIGFFLSGAAAATTSNYGFTSFTASDGTTAPTPNFTISMAPTSVAATAGSIASYTVSVTPAGGFTGAVGLSVSGLPSGTTASFNPTSITTSGSSVLTLGTAVSTPATSFPLTITGTGGGLTRTATATLTVSAAAGTASSSCDLNKDGTTNVVDVQTAVNKYLACTSGPSASSSAFVTQVRNGALGQSCSITAGAHTVVLNWAASATTGVTYNVFRATTSGGYTYTTPLNSALIAGTSFADCTVLSGQTYYYVVRTVDSGGNQSTSSNESLAVVPTP
jgi:hypothetical protein